MFIIHSTSDKHSVHVAMLCCRLICKSINTLLSVLLYSVCSSGQFLQLFLHQLQIRLPHPCTRPAPTRSRRHTVCLDTPLRVYMFHSPALQCPLFFRTLIIFASFIYLSVYFINGNVLLMGARILLLRPEITLFTMLIT